MQGAGIFIAVVLGVCAAACGRQESEPGSSTPAEERAAELADEAYDLSSLSWFREGRPIELLGQAWRPVGQQLSAPRRSFRRVGEFEGMGIYAVADDSPPYDTLFIPVEGGLWQPLEPSDTVISPTSP